MCITNLSLSGLRTIPTWSPDRCKCGAGSTDTCSCCTCFAICQAILRWLWGCSGVWRPLPLVLFIFGHVARHRVRCRRPARRPTGAMDGSARRLRWLAYFIGGGGILDRGLGASQQHHSGKVAAPEFCGRRSLLDLPTEETFLLAKEGLIVVNAGHYTFIYRLCNA
jgi:hypothetical protein